MTRSHSRRGSLARTAGANALPRTQWASGSLSAQTACAVGSISTAPICSGRAPRARHPASMSPLPPIGSIIELAFSAHASAPSRRARPMPEKYCPRRLRLPSFPRNPSRAARSASGLTLLLRMYPEPFHKTREHLSARPFLVLGNAPQIANRVAAVLFPRDRVPTLGLAPPWPRLPNLVRRRRLPLRPSKAEEGDPP